MSLPLKLQQTPLLLLQLVTNQPDGTDSLLTKMKKYLDDIKQGVFNETPLHHLVSAAASQAFVECIFSECGLWSSGLRDRTITSLEQRVFLKINKKIVARLKYTHLSFFLPLPLSHTHSWKTVFETADSFKCKDLCLQRWTEGYVSLTQKAEHIRIHLRWSILSAVISLCSLHDVKYNTRCNCIVNLLHWCAKKVQLQSSAGHSSF